LQLLQIRGVFNGAALVFFSYIGFDSVACSAEEVRISIMVELFT
jgi:amino acid transporter